MAGKVLRSTLPRACEIERSSGGRTNGVATMAVSKRATAPTPHKAHLSAPKDLRISTFDMVSSSLVTSSLRSYRELYITEYMKLQCPICGRGRNPYLVRQPEKPDSIVRDDRCRSPDQRAGIHRVRTVLRAAADGRGRLWPCPGARRNLRLPRAAFLRALLFRP